MSFDESIYSENADQLSLLEFNSLTEEIIWNGIDAWLSLESDQLEER